VYGEKVIYEPLPRTCYSTRVLLPVILRGKHRAFGEAVEECNPYTVN